MSLLQIRTVPDPVLTRACVPITAFDDALRKLTEDMLETMYAAPGRGLAAPQVGVLQRVFVMDATWREGTPTPMIVINPEVTWRSDQMVAQDEGCLSIPGQLISVTRPDAVELRWQTIDGAERTERFTGFASACTQHEIDHLDGILIAEAAA